MIRYLDNVAALSAGRPGTPGTPVAPGSTPPPPPPPPPRPLALVRQSSVPRAGFAFVFARLRALLSEPGPFATATGGILGADLPEAYVQRFSTTAGADLGHDVFLPNLAAVMPDVRCGVACCWPSVVDCRVFFFFCVTIVCPGCLVCRCDVLLPSPLFLVEVLAQESNALASNSSLVVRHAPPPHIHTLSLPLYWYSASVRVPLMWQLQASHRFCFPPLSCVPSTETEAVGSDDSRQVIFRLVPDTPPLWLRRIEQLLTQRDDVHLLREAVGKHGRKKGPDGRCVGCCSG